MTSPYRLVFFGNERLVSGLKHTDAPILRGLIEHGYDIVAVVVSHSDGTSRNARKLEVAQVAEDHNIPVLSPEKPTDIIDQLTNFHANAAVLAAYGRILPQRVLDVFAPIGIINIHPSLLPRYRGSTPIESTILNGDKVAGVSIMQLTNTMDEGPIYAQKQIEIALDIEKFDLYEKLSKVGSDLLFDSLPNILSNTLLPKPQENTVVSVTSLIAKSDGVLNPTTDDATTLERKIRAYQGFPKPHLNLFNNDVIVTSSKVVAAPTVSGITIPCAQKTWLEVTSLIAPSGREMSGQDFLRGYAK